MSSEITDDQILMYARKRQRRNAIKPYSAESIALRDFSLQAQLNVVSISEPVVSATRGSSPTSSTISSHAAAPEIVNDTVAETVPDPESEPVNSNSVLDSEDVIVEIQK